MKTFVVRLFVPAGPEIASGELHGVLEEVAVGQRWTFDGGEALLELLVRSASQRNGAPSRTDHAIGVGSEEK